MMNLNKELLNTKWDSITFTKKKLLELLLEDKWFMLGIKTKI
jgi:hypothetical protein